MNVVDELVARVMSRCEHTGCVVIGIAGPPGSGKTTLSELLRTALAARIGALAVAAVPMDGFHLADVELVRLGRSDRKGAPDTFDVDGYAELLTRICRPRSGIVYAPAFGRDIEQPIAGAIPVHPDVRVVITEGNYLLLDRAPWSTVAAQIDEIWYCVTESELRIPRLIDRHIQFGKTPDDARRWVAEVDEPNARLVEESAVRADVTVDMGRVAIGEANSW